MERSLLQADWGLPSLRANHSGVMSTANVMLMNSSFLLIVSKAPRTLPTTSADPRCSTQIVSSMIAVSRASWF